MRRARPPSIKRQFFLKLKTNFAYSLSCLFSSEMRVRLRNSDFAFLNFLPMAYIPDVCYDDLKTELISDRGVIKHAAMTLYGSYCKRRNKNTELCFPSLDQSVKDTGIPKTNVCQLRAFLDSKGWIHVYDSGVIRPLKGFYSEEEIFFTRLRKLILHPVSVLIIRILVLKNRTLVLIIRTLFKGNLNQPIEPAQLTSEGAKNAPHAPPDKNFQNQSAGKPVPHSPAKTPANAAPARKPVDERRFNPAVQMVKEITGRFPPKDIWDRVISDLGEKPDEEFFRSSYVAWRSFSGNAQNFDKWLFEPNETKQIPQRFENGNGGKQDVDWRFVGKSTETNERNEPIPFDERVLRAHLLDFQVMQKMGEDFTRFEKNYTPEGWVWLMENLENER